MAKNKVEFDDQIKKDMIEDIKNFFSEERGESIGELAAMLVLDLFLDKMAIQAYNQGVRDALQYMSERIEDGYSLEK